MNHFRLNANIDNIIRNILTDCEILIVLNYPNHMQANSPKTQVPINKRIL